MTDTATPVFPRGKSFSWTAGTARQGALLLRPGRVFTLAVALWALITLLFPELLTRAMQSSGAPAAWLPAHAAADNLTQVLARQEFKEVSLGPSNTGHQQVTGWVNNAQDLTQLRHALEHRAVRLSVASVEEQIRFAHEFLGGPGRQLQVQYQGQGRFFVRATTNDEAAFRLRLQQWPSLAPAVRETQLEHTVAAPPASKSAAPVGRDVPARDLLPGVDGICAYGDARYLTAGQHYVFEGAQLKDGLVIRSIGDSPKVLHLIAERAPRFYQAGGLTP